MPSAAEIKAASAYVEMILRDKVSTQLAKIGEKFKSFAGTVNNLGMKAFGGALPGPVAEVMRMAMSPAGAFVGFQAAAKVFADAGHEMAHGAARAGMTVEQFSRLKYAAEASGVGVESLEGAITKMQRSLVQAAQGGDEPNKALRELGLTVQDFAGKNAQEQFMLFADKLGKLKDPALRTAAAMAIFGRGAAEMFPMLDQGRQGIEALIGEAEKMGFVMGGEAAEGAEKLWLQFRLVQKATTDVVKAIGSAVAGVQGEMLDKVLNLLLGIRDWIRGNKEVAATIAKVVAMVVFGGGVLVVFGGALSAIASIFTALGVAAAALGTILGVVLSPLGLLLATIIGTGASAISSLGGFGKAWDWLKEKIGNAAASIQATIEAVWSALAGGDPEKAWAVISTGAAAAWAKVKLSFTEAWSGVKAFIAESFFAAIDALKGAWVGAMAWLQGKWITVREGIVSGLLTMVETLYGAVAQVFGKLGETLDNMVTSILEKLPERFGGLSSEDADSRREEAAATRERMVSVAAPLVAGVRDRRKKAADDERQGIDQNAAKAQKAIDQAGDKRRGDAKAASDDNLAEARDRADQAVAAWHKAWNDAMDVEPNRAAPVGVKPAGVFDLEGAMAKSSVVMGFSGAALQASGRGGPIMEIKAHAAKIAGVADAVLSVLAGDVKTSVMGAFDVLKKVKNATFK